MPLDEFSFQAWHNAELEEPYDSSHWFEDHDWHGHQHRGYCPCPIPHRMDGRFLQDGSNSTSSGEDSDDDTKLWEVIVTLLVVGGMFAVLIIDLCGADSAMLTALTIFMVTEIVSVNEGLVGFSNEGLLTVMVLFVVAEGISKTGALDWYMGILLGRPKTIASAQSRLMVPIAIISAFLNNTPVVAVMIPIVQRWGKNVGINPQQLLIPLSFASIIGGTCTLIGTSTNLIVKGLLDDRYAGDDSVSMGIFDVGEYGVPIAIAAVTYMLIASPFLLPGGAKSRSHSGANPLEDNDDVLLGARLTQWSPAAGRSVKRSGLRDTGGIYLVSVHRFATGNVHRAVGQDFVLNVGDILYFTGLLEGFGAFCEEHGLEMITNEVEATIHGTANSELPLQEQKGTRENEPLAPLIEDDIEIQVEGQLTSTLASNGAPLATLYENKASDLTDIPIEVGVTKASLVQADNAERLRSITRMTDMIRGIDRDEPEDFALTTSPSKRQASLSSKKAIVMAPKVVVTIEKDLVVIAIDSRDRVGLLLDVAKGLLSLNLQLHHTEAAVVDGRSLSIWRCEPMESETIADVEQIWTVMNALLEIDNGILAVKKRGLQVIRARVTPVSRLLGKTALDVDFRGTYKVAVVAVQKGGKNVNQPLSTVVFQAGDTLILQASDDSPLLVLKPPSEDFYRRLQDETKEEATSFLPSIPRPSSYKSLANLVTKLPTLNRRPSQNESLDQLAHQQNDALKTSNESPDADRDSGGEAAGSHELPAEATEGERRTVRSIPFGGDSPDKEISLEDQEEIILRDLEVVDTRGNTGNSVKASREFLTAMAIAKNSALAGQTAAQSGISKLPGVVLISIERPNPAAEDTRKSTVVVSIPSGAGDLSENDGTVSVRTTEPTFTTIEPDAPLMEGDVLWFAGSASAVGDLRKIPGLVSYESDEVAKMNENVFDRRLVQAVIARQGPLAGKTVKQARFRTRYGAAVIAVHREGKRIHDHPGNIVLQAGDVLLLEAGSAFIGKSAENERSFALLSEVKDSAPPRLRFLVPALVITALMLLFATLGVASLLVCALVASILMVLLGILSQQEARDAVNWDVYVTIASAFGIGIALVNSGVAEACANGLVSAGEAVGMGDAGLYGAVYLATMIISNVVTNNAAAALVFPIAMDAAEQTGADVLLMSFALMLGASHSFMTPFGYTTNLMIYGPGGYKSKDFLAIGGPLQLLLFVLSTLLLGAPTEWWVSWLVTSAVFAVAFSLLVIGCSCRKALNPSESR